MLLFNSNGKLWQIDDPVRAEIQFAGKLGGRLLAGRFPRWNNVRSEPFLEARLFRAPSKEKYYGNLNGNPRQICTQDISRP